MLDYLELTVTQMKLAEEGITEVIGLGVMDVGVELADGSPVDEVVAATLDGSSCCHSAEATCRSGTRVAGVPRFHGLWAADHIRVGAVVSLRRWWGGVGAVDGCFVMLECPSFIVRG